MCQVQPERRDPITQGKPVEWGCEDCGVTGTVTLADNWDVWGAMHTVRLHHAELALTCESIKLWPSKDGTLDNGPL